MMKWGYQRHPNATAPNGLFFGKRGRSRPVQMLVVHTGEFDPYPSGGPSALERLSTYMGNTDGRPAAWHTSVGHDGVLHELPGDWTGAHVRHWNSRTVGIEIATKHDLWRELPSELADGMIENLARVSAWYCRRFDIPVSHVTSLASAEAGDRGITGHATLDAARRRDPGPDFPWSRYLLRVEELLETAAVIVGMGDRGPEVGAVQAALHERGYGNLVGPVDGDAGPKFDDAVRAFEGDNGLVSTGLWMQGEAVVPPRPGDPGDTTSLVSIGASVGSGGVNKPEDRKAVNDRLKQLGFVSSGRSLEHSIRLFQAAKDGRQTLSGSDGRVDPGHDTMAWLNAENAPRWVQMPAGSEAEGFRSKERTQLSDNHGWGTSWLADTLRQAASHYRDNYLHKTQGAPLMWSNDVSPKYGGDTPDHAGHEAGLQLDIVLPPGNASRGYVVGARGYDRAAARAMLEAFGSVEGVKTRYLNDEVLIKQGHCRYAKGHDNHIHIAIAPPARVPGQGKKPGGTDPGGGDPELAIDWNFIGQREGFETTGYVPTDSSGRPINQSGVTIAGGFDLGQHDEPYCRQLGMPESIIIKFRPYFGKKRDQAQNSLNATPLVLSEDEARTVDRLVKTQKALVIEGLYNNVSSVPFRRIHPAAQTVIVSVLFQYGRPRRTPKFWGMVTSQNWVGAIKELRDFGDDFSSRRRLEADYLEWGLANRSASFEFEGVDAGPSVHYSHTPIHSDKEWTVEGGDLSDPIHETRDVVAGRNGSASRLDNYEYLDVDVELLGDCPLEVQ